MRCLLLAAALLLTGGLGALDGAPAPEAVAITLAVSDFQDRHPFLEQDWIATALPDLVVASLLRAARGGPAGVLVLDRSAIAALESEAHLGGDAGPAHGAGATHVLGGSFIVTDDMVQLDVALSAIGQPPSWSQHYSGPLATLRALARRIAGGALASVNALGGDAVVAGGGARDLPVAALVAFHRGQEAARRGDHAWALADLLRTCKLAPDFGEAWLLLGTTLEDLGRPAAALAAWEQASLADPDDPAMPATLFRLARAMENPSDQGPARRIYQRLVDDYPFALAPADIVGRSAERSTTYALLAANRLAALLDTPAGARAAASPAASSSTPASAPAGPASAPGPGGSAIIAAARMRQYQLRLDAHARSQYLSPYDDYAIRHALFEASGGWPAELPAVRLRADQAVRLPMSAGNYQLQLVVPPAGFQIASLSAALAPQPGFDATGFAYTLTAECRDLSSNATIALVEARGGAQTAAAIDAPYAGGFFATVQPKLGSLQQSAAGKAPDLLLSATLRPNRPGQLWVMTQPPGMFIRIDGAFRGVSPCLIRDCAPGRAELEADTRDRSESRRPNQQSPYLRFHGTASITIASAGETRVEWAVPHEPDAPAGAWSALRLAATAPPAGTIGRDALYALPAANPIIAAHPRLGWIAAWTLEREVLIAASRDGRDWNPPLPLHANPITGEALLGLAVAPSGQILALFLRDHSVYGCVGDNLLTWSAPVAILAGKPDNTPRVIGALADAQGRWTVVLQRYQLADQVYASADGRSWKLEQSAFEPPQGLQYDYRFSALDTLPDGSPALVLMGGQGRMQCILRFGLGEDRHWTLHDRSPPLDPGRGIGIQLAGDHLYDILGDGGHGSRWLAGGR